MALQVTDLDGLLLTENHVGHQMFVARSILASYDHSLPYCTVIALVDGIFGGIHAYAWWFPTSLEQIFGWVFAPVAWLIGIPWHDCTNIGN